MKRTALLISVLVINTVVVGQASGAPPRFQRGDSNLDGAFDLSDATHTLGYLFLGRPRSLGCADASDSNDTGTVDLTDAIHSLQFLFLGGAPLPPPFEQCGWDPTRDELDCGFDFPGCEPSPPRGQGLFSEPVSYSGHGTTNDLAFGDLNGDTVLDFATTGWSFAGVSVRLGAGDGTLGELARYADEFGLQAIAIGDVDVDGDLDIAAVNSDSFPVSVATVLLGAGDGTFGAPVDYPLRGRGAWNVALEDLDADGTLDIAVAAQGNYGFFTLPGVGDGSFRSAVDHGFQSSVSLALSDFDRDGVLDLALVGLGGPVMVRRGVGNGAFGDVVRYLVDRTTYDLVAGDIDDNGALDLVVASGGNDEVSILLGVGDGTFADVFPCAAGDTPQSPALGDINGDGVLDLAVTNLKTNEFSILIGVGDGAFDGPVSYTTGDSPRVVSMGDVNGDGALDVAVGHFNSHDVWIRMGW